MRNATAGGLAQAAITHLGIAFISNAPLLARGAGARIPVNERVLPSWNAGPVKAAIVDFVARVTEEGGPDYVPPRRADRDVRQ